MRGLLLWRFGTIWCSGATWREVEGGAVCEERMTLRINCNIFSVFDN